ncbi:ChrR family anti-sigma-E factor [uncultured Shimia sp.]|uniref:ChrR family anti-sigma-E factor n=1 Tax=uncultured Shimia sp. TaxID=573152 RepID=UPI002628F130|nr:ChrR family anti-sigma-E factor [uncultured Shimia sp.]
MSDIRHHIPEPLLLAYASGNLPHAYAVVVAAHISVCDQCRAASEGHSIVGGQVMEDTAPQAVSEDMKSRLMAMLDGPDPLPPTPRAKGLYPAPVAELFSGEQPKWKGLGMGVKQSILSQNDSGSVRLLYIPGGRAMPHHGHNGLELTLVLQGAFSDETGRFQRGDVELGLPEMEHTPIAEAGPDCICLAATDARLKFNSLIPRLMQPFLNI